MLAVVQRQYTDGHAGRKQPEIIGKLLSTEEKGVRVLDLWPREWRENMTHGHGTRQLARLWRYELRWVRISHLTFWGLERVGEGSRARWYGQTWEVDWTTEEILKHRESIIRGPLTPSIKQIYSDADDPDHPFD